MLLDQPPGTANEWTTMATSAALETTNILCCAYLEFVVAELCGSCGQSHELLPSPPRFSRDFAESLLEFALMGQAVASDQVILARTRFEIDATARQLDACCSFPMPRPCRDCRSCLPDDEPER